jgi:uncharacterized protein (DUF1778 family)
MEKVKPEKARFDARLTKEQKQFFERAAAIGGYRSLSDFVVSTVEERAIEIIRESESIITSQRDSEIFFEAVFNSAEPNKDLVSAIQKYNQLLAE